jgi:hypothetical protein
MTAGQDGTPENDDPFGYLYRNEGGEQPEPVAPQPGMPRTSHHQVSRVGERRVANPNQPPAYGYPQPQSQSYDQGQGQQQYGRSQAGPPQQRAQQGYEPAASGPRQQPPGGGRRSGHQSGGGAGAANRKGLLIAAVAVVAAVAVGIAFAMTNSSGDGKDEAVKPTPSVSGPATTAPSTEPTASAAPAPFDSKRVDAATLSLAGGAKASTQWPGASAANGTYVDTMTGVGASVVWAVTVPQDGAYTFFVTYGNAGQDATLTLAVNGKPRTDPVKLKNYGSYTDWARAWSNHTYSWVDLKKGVNTLSLTCAPGNQCAVNLDQVRLKQGQVTNEE